MEIVINSNNYYNIYSIDLTKYTTIIYNINLLEDNIELYIPNILSDIIIKPIIYILDHIDIKNTKINITYNKNIDNNLYISFIKYIELYINHYYHY